jgi:ABC-type branched-subunit amino acid transport system ATPase component
MSNILEIRNLVSGYVPGVDILHGIYLNLKCGEAVGILGLNGSGKSTLGRSIVGLTPFRKGEIVYKGQDITGMSTDTLAKEGVRIMHQGGLVFPVLTVWDNLAVACGGSPESLIARLSDFIPILGCEEKWMKKMMADKLSGGQRHQLALAMTLATDPSLVVLDEPSAGLSPKAVDEMYVMLTKMQEKMGLSIILIEQNISKAIGFCDRCLLINQGKVEKEFTSKEITEVEKVMFSSVKM